jgi:hypothetical protein
VTDPASVDRVMGALDGPFDAVIVATGILAPEGAAPEKSLDAIDAAVMARTLRRQRHRPALVLARSRGSCRARGGRSWAC